MPQFDLALLDEAAFWPMLLGFYTDLLEQFTERWAGNNTE